ncbi:MAG: VOC family protein [Halothermotrichaceae bacterium]
MKPKLESAYICVEDMERAVAFYQWFLDREGISKSDSIN